MKGSGESVLLLPTLSDRGHRPPKLSLQNPKSRTPKLDAKFRSKYILEAFKVRLFGTLNYLACNDIAFLPRHSSSPFLRGVRRHGSVLAELRPSA
jgi:hypothetical protein